MPESDALLRADEEKVAAVLVARADELLGMFVFFRLYSLDQLLSMGFSEVDLNRDSAELERLGIVV